MLKLSIITINKNNASGLQKTMESVFAQTSKDFEYIVIDGASTDESIRTIQQFNNSMTQRFRWLSEPDTGIYNAMNKGLKIAQGEYVQFLNSGDTLAAMDVTEKMLHQVSIVNYQLSIIYGNMLKPLPKGILCDRGFAGKQPTLLDFYNGTLNHSPAFIRRSLFDKYGLYDETLKIVSDWKWYLQAIIFGQEKIEYRDIDVTVFDMNGISTTNQQLDKNERKQVLASLLSPALLKDYEQWAFPVEQMKRLNKYWLTRKLVWWMERGLFKWEKWTR
ncbi:glycosyltransferase family 2 protein [Paludibacter sp.]|uniref:glycosyltransferase family 2 protein n=1 Tax=Paludibacter sp. TaxID=1898105 RepID=UPI001354B279|nr:glycosyltransferase family 2 protein [Paludibacter sp.]MTK52590.1 glycosyltransferase [Paludibacter sp.]